MLSSLSKKRLLAEKEELEASLERVTQELNSARSQGDLRENAEYEAAKVNFTYITSRLREIQADLSDDEGEEQFGNTISPGKLLKITYFGDLDAKGKITPLESPESFVLMFDKVGNSIIEGVLHDQSDLGKLIDGGREGRYFLSKGRGSLVYDISVLGEEHYESFLEQFPVDKKKRVQALLAGEL